ncbi:anaphase promoting complex subunit cdc16 [Dissophora globulifera]|uniref:Anaphase promoting complex subunit cdc16 n=1 Tax=Dissophora globulifera TaxID=979702 RepID=A0A9P6RMI2_9FUNG|nr:anaphase promoting complex subunit cdc16 [Dissophora globulifera]
MLPLHIVRSDYDRVEHAYRDLNELTPKDVSTPKQSTVLLLLEQHDEAIKFLHKVVEKMQRSQRKNVIWETTWLNLVHSYRKLGKYSEAEIYLSKVDAITTAGPTKASALVGLGFIYQIMGQTSDAVECYHRVLAIRPSDHTASEMLRRIMEDRVHVTEMEWMREYLPKELRDDEEVEQRLRSMKERNTRQSKE